MALASTRTLRAHLRKLSDKKLRALHKTVNDAAQLASIASGEGANTTEAESVRTLVNEEHARRFGGSLQSLLNMTFNPEA